MHYRGRLPDGACVSVAVAGTHIATVERLPADDALPYLLPVLVDLQHNGSLGIRYDSLWQHEPADLETVGNHLRRHGVGRCLMTFTTYPLDKLLLSAARVAAWLAQDAALNRLFPGIFHEGVFISPVDGWRGAHALEWIRQADYDAIQAFDDAAGGRVRIVNVAPEQPGGLDFIARAVDAGKLVALGHCGPDAATVHEAVRRGASLVTHFGNGAPGQIHRHKNPLWAFLNNPGLRLGLIGDGFHLPPDLIGAALRCKGPGGCFAVSDAASFAGCPPGAYSRPDGRPFTIEPDGLTHMNNRDILAGSWFQQDRCVEILATRVGLPLPEAWRLCSEIPAAIIGETLPAIAVGEEASFVLARLAGGRLLIEQSVHLGVPYLEQPLGTGMPVHVPASRTS